MEYTVHYMKGTRVGARSLRMIHVTADSADAAIAAAKPEAATLGPGYRLTRVDHFDGDSYRLIIDR